MKNTEFNLSAPLTITQLFAWMDGGSTTLTAKDENGNNFTIEFIQKMFPVVNENGRIPGSILINDQLVDIRSTLERSIITALKSARFEEEGYNAPDSPEMQLVWDWIDFTESEDYVAMAKKFNRI
jgi:hypothetical protein